MFDAKKYVYVMVMLCFLIASLSFHSWAGTEEESKKVTSSDQEKTKSQHNQVPAQDQPRISFDALSYDAGEVCEGDKVSHTFIVKNIGTAQLDINRVRVG